MIYRSTTWTSRLSFISIVFVYMFTAFSFSISNAEIGVSSPNDNAPLDQFRTSDTTSNIDVLRWQQQERELAQLGFENPSLFLGTLGPRFFDPETWTRAIQEKAEPGTLYQPANTWAHWVRADQWIYVEAKKNVQNGQIPKIDLKWLTGLYAKAMGGIQETVTFRDEDILGMALIPRNRLSFAEYQTLKSRESQIKFFTTSCEAQFPSGLKHFRDMSSEQITKLVIPEESEEFRIQRAQNAICGFFLYPELEKVPELIAKWIEDFNQFVSLGQAMDAYAAATSLSRSLVTIHPFMDGNGRLSRLIQDYILMSRGIPPAQFKDMNKDYLRTAVEWQEEMREGSLKYLEQQKDCIDYHKKSSGDGGGSAAIPDAEKKAYLCKPVDLKHLVPRKSGIFG